MFSILSRADLGFLKRGGGGLIFLALLERYDKTGQMRFFDARSPSKLVYIGTEDAFRNILGLAARPPLEKIFDPPNVGYPPIYIKKIVERKHRVTENEKK